MNEIAEMPPQLKQHVLSIIKQMLPRNMQSKVTLEGDVSLTDLGLSSMSKIALLHRFEQELKVDLSQSTERVGEIVTISDVLDFIQEVLQNA